MDVADRLISKKSLIQKMAHWIGAPRSVKVSQKFKNISSL